VNDLEHGFTNSSANSNLHHIGSRIRNGNSKQSNHPFSAYNDEILQTIESLSEDLEIPNSRIITKEVERGDALPLQSQHLDKIEKELPRSHTFMVGKEARHKVDVDGYTSPSLHHKLKLLDNYSKQDNHLDENSRSKIYQKSEDIQNTSTIKHDRKQQEFSNALFLTDLSIEEAVENDMKLLMLDERLWQRECEYDSP